MQQAVGLACMGVDRHAGADEVVTDFEKLNTQVGRRRVLVNGGEFFDRDRFFPDAHKGSKQTSGCDYNQKRLVVLVKRRSLAIVSIVKTGSLLRYPGPATPHPGTHQNRCAHGPALRTSL